MEQAPRMKERVRTCTNPSRSSAPSPLAQALTGTPSNKPASYYSAPATKFSNPSLYPLPYGGNISILSLTAETEKTATPSRASSHPNGGGKLLKASLVM